jgi:phage shock protein A
MLLWVGLPLILAVLAFGPSRVRRTLKSGWDWLFRKRLEPEEILTQVVKQHTDHVARVKQALAQADAAELDVQVNIEQSEKNIAALEEEARRLASRDDALGARGALYKLNLERLALDNFRQQLQRQPTLVNQSRRRLYLLELQLRQYEVGRSILVSQLAEAETVEQQYEIARQFDPFNAVADWQKAEGLVLEKSLNARAMERVYVDTADLGVGAPQAQVDPAVIEDQLAKLRTSVRGEAAQNSAADDDSDAQRAADRKRQKEHET